VLAAGCSGDAHSSSSASPPAPTTATAPAAYNNFETMKIDGSQQQLFGFECAYLSGCPPSRACGPTNGFRSGQAFVSIRPIKHSPFYDDLLYFGGYDCNFSPADGTAWTARASLSTLRLTDVNQRQR
jgi:hypothetical protein